MIETTSKQPLSTDQLRYKECQVSKYVAESLNGDKRCWVDEKITTLDNELSRSGLSDARVLLSFITKSVNDHNGLIETRRKKLRDLRSNGPWWESKLLRGVDFGKVKKLVAEHQHEEAYDIYQLYFGKGKLVLKKDVV